jgi:hypothetical protein
MIEPDEIEDLLMAAAQKHGYDFTGYARASLRRRKHFTLRDVTLHLLKCKRGC